MLRLLPVLLFALLALTACQQRPENFVVKDADFGTWAEFVERWNGKLPGITGIGDPQWANTPHKIAHALAGDPDAYQWISHVNSFKNSASKLFCDNLFAERAGSSLG